MSTVTRKHLMIAAGFCGIFLAQAAGAETAQVSGFGSFGYSARPQAADDADTMTFPFGSKSGREDDHG